MNPPSRAHWVELEAREARFGLRVASRLSEQAERLPHDLSERLRVAREQAVVRARQLRRADAMAPAVLQASGNSLVLGTTPIWVRMASVLPLMLLVLGLVLIQHVHQRAEIDAAAEVDAALLADELPPEAYGDPGFVAFLKQPEQ